MWVNISQKKQAATTASRRIGITVLTLFLSLAHFTDTPSSLLSDATANFFGGFLRIKTADAQYPGMEWNSFGTPLFLPDEAVDNSHRNFSEAAASAGLDASPTVAPTRKSEPVRTAPEAEPLAGALAKQLAAWSPEQTLIETVPPETVLAMIAPFGNRTQFLCRTVAPAQNGESARSSTEPAYAAGILAWNFPAAGKKLLTETSEGIEPRVGYGYQRQRGEFLAALALAGISPDYEIRLDEENAMGERAMKSGTRTIRDLVEAEKRTMSIREDLSLTTIGLAFYVADVRETWSDSLGEKMSLLRLAEEELARPVYWNRAESVNRLLGLTFLSRRFHRELDAGQTDPELTVITEKIDRYLESVRPWVLSLRGENGLWETLFLTKESIAGYSGGVLLSSGSILRWVLLTADREELESEATRRSVYQLALLLAKTFDVKTPLGSRSPRDVATLSAALHAISLYLDESERPTPQNPVARKVGAGKAETSTFE